MPRFELIPQADAEIRSTTGKRAQIIREYLGYVEQLQAGQAGRLEVTEGETTGAVRRRLGAAGRLAGKELVIKRVGSEVFFWLRTGAGRTGRRRGSARKSSEPEE